VSEYLSRVMKRFMIVYGDIQTEDLCLYYAVIT